MISSRTTMTNIDKLRTVLSEFCVGAVEYDEFEPDDLNKSKQTINILKSKLITHNVFENVHQATFNGDKEKINKFFLEEMSCAIAASKSVSAASVNEVISKCIQRQNSDPIKQKLVEKLKEIQSLATTLDELQSKLAERKLKRMEVESEYKKEMLLHKEIIKKRREPSLPSENTMKKLELKVLKINLMRKLIIKFLLSPVMNLDDKWVGVLAEVRHNVDLNDLLG